MNFLEKILLELTIVWLPIGGVIPELGECYTSGYGGAYTESTKTIYICRDNPEYTEFFMYHELGHHFWAKYLTEDERQEYSRKYEESKRNGFGFLREYSRSSVEEDFADNFALVVTNDKRINLFMMGRTDLIREYLSRRGYEQNKNFYSVKNNF